MTKVGKSDREETFARASGNDEVAPIPVVPAIQPEAVWFDCKQRLDPATALLSLAEPPGVVGCFRQKAGFVGWAHATSDSRLPATIATMTETIRIVQPLRSRAFAAASRCRSAATSVSNQSRNTTILGNARVAFGHKIQ